MADQSITVKVVREVSIPSLVGDPLRKYFETCLLLAYGDVAQAGRAPVDQGFLRASLQPGAGTSMVDNDNPPKWAQLGTNVTNSGTSYPTVLEESDTTTYAGGPSKGKATKGWLSQTVQNVAGDVQAAQKRMMDDIAAGWRKSA